MGKEKKIMGRDGRENTWHKKENKNKRRKRAADSMIFGIIENFFRCSLKVIWAVVFRLLLPIIGF